MKSKCLASIFKFVASLVILLGAPEHSRAEPVDCVANILATCHFRATDPSYVPPQYAPLPYVVKFENALAGYPTRMHKIVTCWADIYLGGPPDDLVVFYSGQCPLTVDPPSPPHSAPPVPPVCQSGSIIHVDSQAVGESIPIVGSPFSLVYFTDRIPSRSADYTIRIPLVSSTIDPDLVSLGLEVIVAGQTHTYSFTPSAGLTYDFVWDGKDGSGAYVQGAAEAKVSVTEVYTSGPHSPLISLVPVGRFKAPLIGLGDWSLSSHHYYDKISKSLFFGEGGSRSVEGKLLPSGNYLVASEDAQEAYLFDPNGRHLETKNGLTGATLLAFNYDSAGRLSSIVDAYSNQTTINRDSSGLPTGILAPYGQLTTLTTNLDGRLITVTNPNSESYEITYHSTSGLMQTFENPRGQIATFTYNSKGLLTLDSNSAGNSLALTRTPYDAWTNIIQGTTAVGRVSTSNISQNGSSYSRTENFPDGKSLITTHNGATLGKQSNVFGTYNVSSVSDLRFGAMSKFPSSELKSAGSSSQSITRTQSVTYVTPSSPDPFQIVTRNVQTTVNSKTYSSVYTASTGVTELTSPLGRKEYMMTDSIGNVTSLQKASFAATGLQYDTHGRLNQINQGTRTTSIAYDTEGYVSSITNPMSQTTQYQYDDAGRVTQQTLPDSRVIAFTYDANGNMASITPPGKTAQSFVSNLFDLIMSFFAPATGSQPIETQYTYNNDRQLTGIAPPSGRNISFTYGSTTGTLSTIGTSLGNYSFAYSGGLLSTATAPIALQTSFSYNGGRPSDEITWYLSGFSHRVLTNYNSNFQIHSVDVWDVNSSSRSSVYTYDNDQLMIQAGAEVIARHAQTGFVTSTTLSNVIENYTYNSTYGEQDSHEALYSPSGGPSVSLLSETLVRDALGRVSGKTEIVNGVTSTYGYTFDTAGRLTDVTLNGSAYSHYDYDTNSNRTGGTSGSGGSISATYDAQDRLTAYNGYTYTYNHDGQLSTKVDTTLSQTTTYAYDEMGNLRSVTLPGGSVVSYIADAFDRRVIKKVGSTVTKRFAYSGPLQLVAELNGSGAHVSRFVYGTKSHVPDYMVRSGDTYKIVSDHLGSVRLVVKVSDGSVAQRLDYDEYGRVLTDTNPGFQPFAFAGGLYDPDTKLLRFGARDYDPETGRWTAKDPILFAGGDTNLYGYVDTVGKPSIETNLYGYAFADPINFIDPDGKFAILPWVIRGAIVAGASYLTYKYETDPLFRLEVDTAFERLKELIEPPRPQTPRPAVPTRRRSVACE